ncbi:hypothetical protein MRK42_17210 [Aeromonas sp. 19NY04SH05-1]|uniref:Uncharacterized protein n=1 Tax=Aeromonas sp. 19NY04SH05-1 TaxID=2920537 RepID=A0AAU6T6G4_9GAMM
MSTASINDFKLLNIKCSKYYELFKKSNNLFSEPPTDKLKERFGFYLYMLENLCNDKDIDKLSDYITDTEYNYFLTGERIDDYGVDAIYIDEENKEILLLNFKFREKFNADKMQSQNDAFISTKLVNCILTESSEGLEGKTKDFVKTIISHLKESANKQVISSQAGSLIKISRIRADCSPVNTSN